MTYRHDARFARHAGCFFAPVIVLGVVATVSLVSWLTGSRPWLPLVALVALFGVAITVMSRVAAPLASVFEAADRVGRGDYSVRLRERGPRSMRSVARAFNNMTTHLQSNEQRRRNLMADIAHELRTPLAVIQGRLEGLLDGVYERDDARLRELLEEPRVVSRLVDDLRTLAHSESGALSLHKEPTDVAVLIHDAASAFGAEVDVANEMPLIELDPLRIREVIVNLLSNARRHAKSRVVINARIEREQLTVSVSDDGPGIAADELPKIFERFYKGPASHGSGLGLTIARNLVVAHGGEIHAESDHGTTITFTLPA